MPRPLLPDGLGAILSAQGRGLLQAANGVALGSLGDPTMPADVTGLTFGPTTVRRSATGRDVAEVTVLWDPAFVDTSEDADPDAAGVRGWQVSFAVGTSAYGGDTFTITNSLTLHNLPVGVVVTVRVRALSTEGVPGNYTAASVTTAVDTTPPPVPSAPTVTAVLKGVQITWDGTFSGGAAAPSDLDRVLVYLGTSAGALTVVGDLPRGGGTLTVSTPDFQPRYAALAARDLSGNVSATTATVSATPAQALSSDLVAGILSSARAVGTFGGSNGVRNSRFASGGTSWTATGTVQTTSAFGHRYSTSALLTRSGGAATYLDSAPIPSADTGPRAISAWVYLNSAVQVRVVLYRADTNATVLASLAADTSKTGQWQRIQIATPANSDGSSGTSPGAPNYVVRLSMDSGPDGSAYVTEVQYETGDYVSAWAPRPSELDPASIGSTEIATDAVTSAKIVAGAVIAGKVAADAIGANEIQANSITAAKGQIADAAIITAKIGDAQITTAKIGDAQITSAKVGDVSADRITTGTLRATAKIVAGDPAGNRLEIDTNGIRAFTRVGSVDTSVLNFDRQAGTLSLQGVLNGSTLIGGTIATSPVGTTRVQLVDNSNSDRIQFISGPVNGRPETLVGYIAPTSFGTRLQAYSNDPSIPSRFQILTDVHDVRGARYTASGFLQTGRTQVTTASGNGANITFATPFTSVPTVTCVALGASTDSPVSCFIRNVTTTGFNIAFFQGSVGVAATRTLHWVAEQFY